MGKVCINRSNSLPDVGFGSFGWELSVSIVKGVLLGNIAHLSRKRQSLLHFSSSLLHRYFF